MGRFLLRQVFLRLVLLVVLTGIFSVRDARAQDAFQPEFEDLGFLPGGVHSGASGVSADGAVVVGWGRNASVKDEAFRWEGGTMTGLGFLPGGVSSSASGVSADGAVVVGVSFGSSTQPTTAPNRWTQAAGMESIPALLVAAGVDITGFGLIFALGVSASGNTIVGSGSNVGDHQHGFFSVAWIARLGPEEASSPPPKPRVP